MHPAEGQSGLKEIVGRVGAFLLMRAFPRAPSICEVSMKAVIHDKPGEASVLQFVDRPVPEPGAGEIRVRLSVSGVNPTDWKSRRSAYPGEPSSEPRVPNLDGAGVIDAVGDGVDLFSPGDRVWTTLAGYLRPASGTAQEYTVLPVDRVFSLPDSADFDLGASLGVPAMTAHRLLTVAEDGPSRLAPGALDGKIVLVAGGAGAVGHAAIQLARWAGATVIATVSGPAKGASATAAGAQHVIDYHDVDAAAQIRAIVPEGVDIVAEVALDKNLELDLAVLKTRGTIGGYGFGNDGSVTLKIGQYFGLNARLQFVLLYTMGRDAVASAAADINAAIEDGALPVGEEAGLPLHHFPLDQTADAHRAVEDGAVGKVLVRID
jgi:NADPH2:quinone reductase